MVTSEEPSLEMSSHRKSRYTIVFLERGVS